MSAPVHVACEIVVDAESTDDGEDEVRDILAVLVHIGDIKAAYVSGVVETPEP